MIPASGILVRTEPQPPSDPLDILLSRSIGRLEDACRTGFFLFRGGPIDG